MFDVHYYLNGIFTSYDVSKVVIIKRLKCCNIFRINKPPEDDTVLFLIAIFIFNLSKFEVPRNIVMRCIYSLSLYVAAALIHTQTHKPR